MSRRDDGLRLRDMLSAAKEVQHFIADKQRADLDTDILLVRGLSMSIGIIGEAAARASAAFQEENPQLPWPQMIGMRNRIIHAYFDIDLDILWITATVDIPSLIPLLEALLADE